MKTRTTTLAICLIASTVGLFAATLLFGSVRLSLGEIFAELGSLVIGGQRAEDLVIRFRLPRAVTALFVGAGLAVAGLLMQTLFRNPLASPGVLGINAGAEFAVAFTTLAMPILALAQIALPEWVSSTNRVGAAVLGALGAMAIIMAIAHRVRNDLTLILVGVMLGYLYGAAVSVLVYLSDAHEVANFVGWTLGSFARTSIPDLPVVMIAVTVGGLLAWLVRHELNSLLLGERYATSMGVNVTASRVVCIVAAALLSGVATAYCGPVAFIGIASPHLARGLFGTSDHRILIPATLGVGASVGLLTGLIASVAIGGRTLPLNAVTALVGVPVVLAVLRSRRWSRSVSG